ncbi:hypothetical protein [Lacticaseibacillus sharpeae]|uniref:hypothetical protein n=1 Tax=Lacticaseibacillus sharpeae TaxID=1626 RepID=UPI0006D11A52|nr:hypothetical protein [Lacticaseibacillus sharpeae]
MNSLKLVLMILTIGASALTGMGVTTYATPSKCLLVTQIKEKSKMLSIITSVIVGLLMGALVYGLDYLLHGKSLIILGLDLVIGALGSYSGTYLVNYGPHLLGVDVLPTLVAESSSASSLLTQCGVSSYARKWLRCESKNSL